MTTETKNLKTLFERLKRNGFDLCLDVYDNADFALYHSFYSKDLDELSDYVSDCVDDMYNILKPYNVEQVGFMDYEHDYLTVNFKFKEL